MQGLNIEAFDKDGEKVDAGYEVEFIGNFLYGVIYRFSKETYGDYVKEILELRVKEIDG